MPAIGGHQLIDLCEQEISQITGLRHKRPERRMKKRSGQLFKQLGNFVGQVTALHTQVKKTMSPHLAKRLHGREQLMTIYGLPPWRLYQTLIEFEPELAARERLFSKFSTSTAVCQFDPEYRAEMVAKARDAVENPGIR